MEKLTHKLKKTALETNFSGVISIFKDREVLCNEAFGYRDIKEQLPNTTTTIFGTASGTKLFTALGIGSLIDQGLISLDTSMGEIDQRFQGFIGSEASIRQLLTHTSGIFDYYDEEVEQDFDNYSISIPWSELETPSDYYPLFEGSQMKFSPGQRYSYSNGGYVFLGILIEQLTGRLFRNFIQEQVLEKAGMKNSGFFALNDLPANSAAGYFEDRQTTNIYQLPLRGGGDGGMFTTTADLRSFWTALMDNRIMSKQLTQTFLETQHGFNQTLGYGCGIYKRLDDSMYAIQGVDAGVGFLSRHYPAEKLTLSILSNITNGQSELTKVLREYL